MLAVHSAVHCDCLPLGWCRASAVLSPPALWLHNCRSQRALKWGRLCCAAYPALMYPSFCLQASPLTPMAPSLTMLAASPRWLAWVMTSVSAPTPWTQLATPLLPSARALPLDQPPWSPWPCLALTSRRLTSRPQTSPSWTQRWVGVLSCSMRLWWKVCMAGGGVSQTIS